MNQNSTSASFTAALLPAALIGGLFLAAVLGWFLITSGNNDINEFATDNTSLDSTKSDEPRVGELPTDAPLKPITPDTTPVTPSPTDTASIADDESYGEYTDTDQDILPPSNANDTEDEPAVELPPIESTYATNQNPDTDSNTDPGPPEVNAYQTKPGDSSTDNPDSPFGAVNPDGAAPKTDPIVEVVKPAPPTISDAAPGSFDPTKERIAAIRLRPVIGYQADGDHFKAYDGFIKVAKAFPNTPSGIDAKREIQKYEADTDFMTRYETNKAVQISTGLLTMAQKTFDLGHWKEAKETLAQLNREYPDSQAAKDAQPLLKKVNRILGE